MVVDKSKSFSEGIRSILNDLKIYEALSVDTGIGALQKIVEINPDVVIMGTSLNGEMDCVQTANQIQKSFNIPVILIAPSMRSTNIELAKKINPYGFLIEPFGSDNLYVSIEMAIHRIRRDLEPVNNILSNYLDKLSYHNGNGKNGNLFIKKDEKLVKLKINDICWVQALDNYVVIKTNGDQLHARITLKQMEEKLVKYNFARVHRSYIVHLDKIDAIQEHSFIIEDKTIPIGRSYRESLENRIEIL